MSASIAVHLETLFNMLYNDNYGRCEEYLFLGSFGEGLYLSLSRTEEKFDFDLMVGTKKAKVVIERKNVEKQNFHKIFMLESSHLPGYAKLKYNNEQGTGYCYVNIKKNAWVNKKAAATTKFSNSLSGCKPTSFGEMNSPALMFDMPNYNLASSGKKN